MQLIILKVASGTYIGELPVNFYKEAIGRENKITLLYPFIVDYITLPTQDRLTGQPTLVTLRNMKSWPTIEVEILGHIELFSIIDKAKPGTFDAEFLETYLKAKDQSWKTSLN